MEELVFKYIEVRPELNAPIKALTRGKDGAGVLLRSGDGEWVLASKQIYYQGISRILGGGIEEGEDPQAAAQRELQEEAGVVVDLDRLVPLIHAEVFYDKGDEHLSFSAFVFYCQSGEKLTAGDDVDDFARLSEHDFVQLIEKFRNLPEQAMVEGDAATWADYGKVWGPIHQAAIERVKELGL